MPIRRWRKAFDCHFRSFCRTHWAGSMAAAIRGAKDSTTRIRKTIQVKISRIRDGHHPVREPLIQAVLNQP